MNGYDYNMYHGGGSPELGNNGLPVVIADANLPTQSVSPMPVRYSTDLAYSPHLVESGLRTPATTHRDRSVEYSRVAASGAPSSQKFEPTKQPVRPSLWTTVVRAVIGGTIKRGTAYAAQGDYTTTGAGLGGVSGPGTVGNGRMSTGGTGAITRSNSV